MNVNETSFRGQPIPEIVLNPNFKESDSKTVINKITNMSPDQKEAVTIESVHFDKYRLSSVKLTTGDIINLETAIALARNNMLIGYSTGRTTHGRYTLRSKPSNKNSKIYELPRF